MGFNSGFKGLKASRFVLTTDYYWGDQMEEDEIDGSRSTQAERSSAYRVMVGNPGGKRRLARTKRR